MLHSTDLRELSCLPQFCSVVYLSLHSIRRLHDGVIYYQDQNALSCFYYQANLSNCFSVPSWVGKPEQKSILTEHSDLDSIMTPSCKWPILPGEQKKSDTTKTDLQFAPPGPFNQRGGSTKLE